MCGAAVKKHCLLFSSDASQVGNPQSQWSPEINRNKSRKRLISLLTSKDERICRFLGSLHPNHKIILTNNNYTYTHTHITRRTQNVLQTTKTNIYKRSTDKLTNASRNVCYKRQPKTRCRADATPKTPQKMLHQLTKCADFSYTRTDYLFRARQNTVGFKESQN